MRHVLAVVQAMYLALANNLWEMGLVLGTLI